MRYKIFGERTGLKVSELALGTGMFGQTWGYGATPEDTKRIIDGFADAGGNFIDTADNYQHGIAETLIGDVVVSNRADFIIASTFRRGASRAHARRQQPEKQGAAGGGEPQAAQDRPHRSLFCAHGRFCDPDGGNRTWAGRSRAGRQGCLRGPVEFSGVARGHRSQYGGPQRLDSHQRNPNRIQPLAAYSGTRAAADG